MALLRTISLLGKTSIRFLHSRSGAKVAVLGASGGIGQPMSLLLKVCPLISHLSLYDLVKTVGVGADLSHISTPAKVSAHNGPENLQSALEGADVILIPAGIPRKPGMTRDDLFNVNASIVRDLIEGVAEHAPNAIICIISNPVNSTVPIAAQVLKKKGVYDPKRLFGVTTLDLVRASTFIAELKSLDVRAVNCPVVGGHSGITIIPVLSNCKPSVTFEPEEAKRLTERIQNAGTEVVKAKEGSGSATLSMAYAGMRFAHSVLEALNGKEGIIECALVDSDIVPGVSFMATPIMLGKNGLERNCGLPQLNTFEQDLLEHALPELKKNIERAVLLELFLWESMHGMSSFQRVQQWLTYTRQWHLLDAKWQDPELLAKKIAIVLRGMNKPIFHHRADCGDHVIVYNCRHIALRGFDWKRRDYYFDNRYPRGKASIPAFEIHKVDPCRIMFLEVYSALGGVFNLETRRRNIERLHLLADDVLPEHLLKNVSNQLEQVMRVPKRYDEYTAEERRKIPALFDWPKEFTLTEMEEEKTEEEKKPKP
ncbi:malate dehydrogenase, NAD-dependent [Trichuris suis]|uniref:Malate dehydrogenase, mitochondrial n=1 Tax=Trichuris suis TaxID=68888 RepID=A0A085MFU8_9BILA|nr:hypothetical protein M513_02872 [Trichuris suis]KHJ43958.1 malate dehydrogenase, NAD-dependent [Trichuris suis]